MSDRVSKTKTDRRRPAWLRIVVKPGIVVVAMLVIVVLRLMPGRKRQVATTEAAPVNVTVMTVTAEPEFADTFELPAVAEPNRVVTVSAEVAGRIERIAPKEGSTVEAGDLLVQLNTDLVQPQCDSAKAQMERDAIEFERMDSLVKDDAAAQSDLDNARNELAASRARLEEVRAQLERTRIVAPIGGVLNDLLVEQGEYVAPGTPVAQIVETTTVKVVADVPQRDTGFFAVGQSATVFAEVKGQEQSLVGTITFISELADAQTRSTRMEVSLENKDRVVRSGQIVRVRLTRRILKDVVLIPLLAVIPMEQSKAVFVANASEAHRLEVELGIIRGDRVQVTRGLEPGQKLIIAGHRFVAPGQKVNVVSGTDR